MRALLSVVGLPCALALLSATLWWRPPYTVQLRLEPRPVASVATPVATSVATQTDRWLVAQVVAPLPGVEAVAVGDAVAFDRYGVLAPQVGSLVCTRMPERHLPPVLQGLGGLLPHGNRVSLAFLPAPPPDCGGAR
jgi:hypothetical protein